MSMAEFSDKESNMELESLRAFRTQVSGSIRADSPCPTGYKVYFDDLEILKALSTLTQKEMTNQPSTKETL